MKNVELKSISSEEIDSIEIINETKEPSLSLPLITDQRNNEQIHPKTKKKYRTLHTEEDLLMKKLKERPKFNKNSLFRLFLYTRKEAKLFTLGHAFLLINAGSQIAIPYISGQFLDIVSKAGNIDDLNFKGFIFLSLTLALALSNFAKSFCFSLMSERVSIQMKKHLFNSLITHDISFFDGKKTGELLSRLGSDIATVKWAASGNFSMFIRNIIVTLGCFFILFTISWTLTLYVALIIPLFAGFSAIYSRYSKKYSRLYQDSIADSSIIAEEAFGNIRVVKSFSTEEYETSHFEEKMSSAYEFGYKKSILESFFFSLIIVLINVAVLVVLWYGGSLVLKAELSSGQLASFIFYALFMASSSTAITSAITQLITASGVCERIFELMDYIPKLQNKGHLTDLIGSVEFRDVSFFYPNNEKVIVLQNINLKINPGEVIAFVGSSGGGKSTIVSLIERFYDPSNGKILIDGHDLKNYDLRAFHRKIGLVSQEPSLFSGTIEENIVYGLEEYNQELLDKATKLANCYDFIHDPKTFPKGYNTLVGERGVKLSGGQKQRIAVARALIKEPKILILDEATSALDAENEFQVQKAIETLMKQEGMTIIVIAHRLCTIINCKRIIVISEGKIVDEGKHEELLEKNGAYKNLIEKQIHGYIN